MRFSSSVKWLLTMYTGKKSRPPSTVLSNAMSNEKSRLVLAPPGRRVACIARKSSQSVALV